MRVFIYRRPIIKLFSDMGGLSDRKRSSMKMWKGSGNTTALLFYLNGLRNDGSS